MMSSIGSTADIAACAAAGWAYLHFGDRKPTGRRIWDADAGDFVIPVCVMIGATFGGLAGVLWAHTAGIVSPENVVLTTSVDALLMVVLGGSGTLVGGALGTVIVIALREYLSTVVPWWQYVLGAVYVLTILYLQTGLMGIPERLRQWRARSGDREGEGKLATAAS